MKKLFVAASLMLLSLGAMAQNVQLHYDFGEGRQMITTTVEKFHLDDYGSTYFFVDMDYGTDDSGVDGISMAYWEISRSFKIGDLPFQPRVEYNGGVGRGFGYGYGINSCWLVGAQKTWLSADFSKNFTLSVNYKAIMNKLGTNADEAQHAFQVTGVWGMNFLDDKLTFAGFFDFWREDAGLGSDGEMNEYVFITEPQLWYNINTAFSVGTEIELSNNFAYDGFKVCPTLGVKWTIN